VKRTWKITVWVAAPLIVIAAAASIAHFRAKAGTERYKAQLRAQGEKFSIPELLSSSRMDSGGVGDFAAAKARLGAVNFELLPGAMKMIKPGRARVVWKEVVLPADKTTNVWPELQAVVDGFEAAATEVREILKRHTLQFPADYSAGFDNLPTAPLASLRATIQWFSAVALLDLHAGRPTGAFENIRAVVALPVRYRPERFMISHLVRHALVSMAASVTWEALQYPGWHDEQLAELQRLWESLDLLSDHVPALKMERACALLEYERARRSAARLEQLANGGTATTLDDLAEAGQQLLEDPKEGVNKLFELFPQRWIWKRWTSYGDELWFLKFGQMQITTAREAVAGRPFAPLLTALTNHVELLGEPEPGYLLARAFVGGFYTRFLEKLATGETQRRLVVAAIAIKRYQLRYGKLPAMLSALVPEFVGAIPFDPIDGQPLRYGAQSNGEFLLYSVGLNGADEGGDARPFNESSKSFFWISCRDWCGPSPRATQKCANITQGRKRNGAGKQTDLRRKFFAFPSNSASQSAISHLQVIPTRFPLPLPSVT
jgi:hypothetical protein